MKRVRTYDLHAHALVMDVEALVQPRREWVEELTMGAARNGEASTRYNIELFLSTYLPRLTDVAIRLADMDRMGIDVQVVSVAPNQYYYWADPALAQDIVARTNRHIAALCARHPHRLVGLGTVALQHPALAVEQLTEAVHRHGLRGVEISTRIGGLELSDERFEPFWTRAEELGAVVFIHPLGCSLSDRLSLHYFGNVIGQPAETTLALSHLIFDGVLDRHPDLKICAAHGGGYLPHYIGRSDHAYAVRPEGRGPKAPPSTYLRKIWFDSLVYDPAILVHLIEQVGVSQVVIGTDYPFDMGDTDPLAWIDGVPGLNEAERAQLRGENARRLLGLAGES